MSAPKGLEVDGHDIDVGRLAEICERYGVIELAVFGSVARGDDTPDSDVDLLYVLAPQARLGFRFNDLDDELTELFGRRVDLVSRRSVHPLLRPAVEAQAVTLYAA